MWNDVTLLERSANDMAGERRNTGNHAEPSGGNPNGEQLPHHDASAPGTARSNMNSILVGAVSGLVSAVIIAAASLVINVFVLSEKIDNLDLRISSSDTQMRREIAQSEESIKKYIDFLQNYLFFISESFNKGSSAAPLRGYVPTGNLQNMLVRSYETVDAPVAEYTSMVLNDVYVVKNVSDGRNLTLNEVSERRLLLPYSDGDYESLFYGQLSQNGNWNGHCVINTYKDDQLELITDAQYADGVLISCKQIFPYQTQREGDVWAISNRTKLDGFSTGDTVYIKRSGNYNKEFSLDQASEDDILTVEIFSQSILADSHMVGFYHGNISNGLFNDTTGEAYLAKFFEDGTVRMLYKGPIRDGNIADSRNKGAWFIGKEADDTAYSYYNGPFVNGHTTDDKNYWQIMTRGKIQQILDDNLILHQWEWGLPEA